MKKDDKKEDEDKDKGENDEDVKEDKKDDDTKGRKDEDAKNEKDQDVKEDKKEGEKDEDMRDDTSQDSTAEALERLTSELMFLNESLCESASDSVPESSNVEMEWEDPEEKPETVKKQEIKKEINEGKVKPSEPLLTPRRRTRC